MLKFPFKVLPKTSLGIDIGTSAIKVVELSRWKGGVKLENYGRIQTLILEEEPFRIFEKQALVLATQQTGTLLKQLLKQTGVKSKGACFAIPDFSSFFTAVEFPAMKREELEQAVQYEARRHVPLPLSEVVLDWELVDQKTAPEKEEGLTVMLVAVPKEILSQYRTAAEMSQITLSSLEAEVFSLIRALKKNLEPCSILTEIGTQSTTVSVVRNRQLKTTHSFDISGSELTRSLSEFLEVSFKKAEILKKTRGIKEQGLVREALLPLVDVVLTEVKRVAENYQRAQGQEVQKYILAGGSALLPGLKEYFSKRLDQQVQIADPFQELAYPEVLERSLPNMGPSFAIATGAAMKGLE